MTIQSFDIYTARGYSGDLVDSGPRVIQTGVLDVGNSAGFGKAMKRDASIPKGVELGTTEVGSLEVANIFAISQREYNHEAGVRPSDGTGFGYLETESVSLIRQGYLYVTIDTTAANVEVGEPINVVLADGEFTMATNTDTIMPCVNVVADEFVASGSGTAVLIKVRIDIVA